MPYRLEELMALGMTYKGWKCGVCACPQCRKAHLGNREDIRCSCGYPDKIMTPEERQAVRQERPHLYPREDLEALGLSIPSESEDIDVGSDGVNVFKRLTPKLQQRLKTVGGGKFNDRSREDYAAIYAMLQREISAEDAQATFLASARGRDVPNRHPNVDDYMRRTMSKAQARVKNDSGFKPIIFDSREKNEAVTDTQSSGDDDTESSIEDGIIVQHAHEIELKNVEWLWRGYIAANKLNILAGDPGMGKSTIVTDLIARFTRGDTLPISAIRSPVMSCAFMSAEDAFEDTIGPQLKLTCSESRYFERQR